MAPDHKTMEEKVPLPLNGEAKTNMSRDKVSAGMMCGIGSCKPKFMQVFARIGAFTAIYSLSGLTTSSLSIYIISQITTIEKQFGFSSAQSGFLMSCNDIGYLITTLFFSYLARKAHIPRTLWGTTVLFGIAGIICSLSYFIAQDLIFEQSQYLTHIVTNSPSNHSNNSLSLPLVSSVSQTPMCSVFDNFYTTDHNLTSKGDKCDGLEMAYGVGQPNKFSQTALILIAVGMILQGVAKAPRLPFTATYVDDNVRKKKNTAMYMGMIAGMGIFGPAIAFTLGSVFSRKYVTLQAVPISPRHPAWVGAWWLGFVLFGGLSIIVATPLLFFPRRMKSKPVEDTVHTTSSSSEVPFKTAVLDFLKTLWRLATNRVYMPQTTATCIQLFSVSGMMAFQPKYLETQFFIPAWKANMLLGIITVVAASVGTVTGGFVVTKRKLSPLQCVKLNIVIIVLSLVQNGLGFWFGCGNASIAGLSIENFVTDTNMTCGHFCNCDNNTYFPVCGSDLRNYFSPCHAGCTQQVEKLYSNCSCIPDTIGSATPGLCEETGCSFLYPFLVITVFASFLGTLSMMPGFIVNIRSVSEHDKSMAVGLSAFLMTLVGWMAGPIVFGIIVDTACIVWSTSCSGKEGACSLYDNDSLRIKKHTFELIPKICVISLYLFVFYHARKKTDWSVDPADRMDDAEENAESERMIGSKHKDPETSLIRDNWKSDPIYKGKNSQPHNGSTPT